MAKHKRLKKDTTFNVNTKEGAAAFASIYKRISELQDKQREEYAKERSLWRSLIKRL